MQHIRTSLAEIVGTFILVVIGTGSMMLNEITSGEVTHIGVCAAWGLAVYLAIWFAERIGKGHFNPAVTITVAIKEKMPVAEAGLRMVAQTIGAIVASIVLRHYCPTIKTLGQTLPNLPIVSVFLIEVVISFALMVVIEYTVAKKFTLYMAALAIAVYVCVAAIITGPYTGCSMNPARSLGPALIGGGMEWMWLYTLAPMVGMLLTLPVLKRTKIMQMAVKADMAV